MENRRPIHYNRNTMIVPKLGNKSKRQMVKKPLARASTEAKIPQNISPKVCSTLECPRCRAEQKIYRATCWRCQACFYCGLTGGGPFQCHICGNHIPKEDREKIEQRSIKIA